ncbi:LysR family transcriptional regulator [Saccharopolyspora elongata]|uniref:LysR family transcriptional regulator n=1 Tax=Saccharopolyspora elongata TaxID=2530387 RepID=A0A4R4YZ25_9PSEU|nr:LysR family transcriptional regulator [Saccharopolyspora elongata]TDD50808.1 LysR family transcriptional regulator [Saccharopolyspora elongata]
MLFRQLEYLVALSRERHFVRAAQACSVSQPALSEAIRKLEEELDVPLIRRERRFQGLTPEGERIVRWAEKILADRDSMRLEVSALRTGLTGQLSIGVIPTAAPAVPPLTARFCAEHPLARVQVMADLPTDEIFRRLQNFELDVAIGYLADAEAAGMVSVALYRERYVLLTPAEGEFATRESVTWAEAGRVPLCLLTPSMRGRRTLDGVFAEIGISPVPQLETDSIAGLCAHVATGRWSSIVPAPFARAISDTAGVKAVPLVAPDHEARVGLVMTAREPGSVMGRAFIEVARSVDVAGALE